ncbi:ATP-binding protein [Dietzia maris]|uniref:ATP-binding protein n=1 Tax=Dietzia maris TaxID=37915 RepID=UPI0037C7475F
MWLWILFGVIVPLALAGSGGAVYYGKRREKKRATSGSTGADTAEDAIDALVSSKKVRKDGRRLNLRYAQDAPFLFISDDEVWTGVIPESTQDEFQTFGEQAAMVSHLTDFYTSVITFFQSFGKEFAGGVRCHEITRFQPANVQRWEEQYEAQCWNPSRLFRDLVHTGVSPHIAESTPERKRMLLVKLGNIKGDTAMTPLDALLGGEDGVVDEYFDANELDHFRQRARQFHIRMSRLQAVPMDRADLSWLVRKAMSGHFQPEAEIGYDETRPWRNSWFDRWADLTGRPLPDAVEILEPNPETGIPRKSYTTTLTVSDVADGFIPFTAQTSWGKALRSLPYPAEVSWRFYLMGEDEWIKIARKRVGNLRDEQKNRNEAAGQPLGSDTGDVKFDEAMAAAEALSRELALTPKPVMIGQLRLTVSAPTLDELADAARDVSSAVGGMFVTERPRGVQLALLEEQIPGKVNTPRIGKLNITGRAGGIAGGERYTDIEALAMARLDSSPTIGDSVEYGARGTMGWQGHAIGYSRENGALVHFDPHVQIARNKAAGVAVIGASGGGKSTLSLMLFFWMSESGVQTVVADPKDDFRKFAYYISFGNQVNDPEFAETILMRSPSDPDFPYTVINRDFWEQTEIINLWRGRRGMLDPWLMCGGNFREGATLAREIMELLLVDKDELKIVDRALQKMGAEYDRAVSENRPFRLGLSRLVEYIGQDIEYYQQIADGKFAGDTAQTITVTDMMAARQGAQERQDVADRLTRAAEEVYANLLFGDGSDLENEEEGGLRALNKRRTIITLKGLNPPRNKPTSQWSTSDRNASAALYTALHRISTFFLSGSTAVKPNGPSDAPASSPPRALIIDEGYILTRIPAGKDLITVALRQGRSYNFVVIFISQQASDIAQLQAETGEQATETSTNQFPTVFVFKQGSMDEARDALRLLRDSKGVDNPAEANELAMMLTSEGGHLETGVCVMKDVDGRVGTVCTDPMFVELWAASETNPERRSQHQQGQISPFGREWTVDSQTRDALRTGVVRGVVEAARLDRRQGRFEMDDWESHVGVAG